MVAHTGKHVVVGLKNGEEATYDKAVQYCQGEIASVHSTAENEEIKKAMSALDIYFAWIGLKRRTDNGDSWSKNYWEDGTAFDYSNWAIGSPRPFEEDGNVDENVVIHRPPYNNPNFPPGWLDG